MKSISRQWWLFSAIILTLLTGGLLSETLQVQASGNNSNLADCRCLHNATQKKDIKTWGTSGYITWTNPPLNGGQWSYHRVAVAQWSPWRFVEFGWQKTSAGIHGLIAYENGSGLRNIPISGVSAATHQYSFQYDPNSSKYWFFLDGLNIYNVNANFSSGNASTAGGEVPLGIEGMNNTKLYDLRYLQKNANNTFTFVSWNGHVNYAVDPPYYNANGSDSNTIYDRP